MDGSILFSVSSFQWLADTTDQDTTPYIHFLTQS